MNNHGFRHHLLNQTEQLFEPETSYPANGPLHRETPKTAGSSAEPYNITDCGNRRDTGNGNIDYRTKQEKEVPENGKESLSHLFSVALLNIVCNYTKHKIM